MSGRVTRSAARQSAESPSSTTDPPQPSVPPPPTATRKRKVAQRPASPDQEQTPTPPPTRPAKRARRGPAEPTTGFPTAAVSAKPTKSGKAKAKMSEPKTPQEVPDEEPSSENVGSSKRKSNKGKKSSSSGPDAGTSTSASRRSKPSSSKKADKTTDLPASDDSPAHESSHDEAQDVGDDDDRPRHYDPDDNMEDDPFESQFLSRRGGTSSIHNTLHAIRGMMTGATGRLREILANLQRKDDPTVQRLALERLSNELLMSTEDTIAGQFSPDLFVKELVSLMQPNEFGEDNPEMQLLAARCIANMMEAVPASTATVVYGGAVPVLLQKLDNIEFMDLPEQALLTLEKISVDFPASIVREGGLTACLTYLDFLTSVLQRTAVTIAANCCRNISDDSFTDVKNIMPVLLNVLENNSDQKVVEQGCLCVSRIAESFKYQDDKLDELMNTELLRAILRLLIPGSTNLIGSHIHTQFLRVLSSTAKASPRATVELLTMNVVDTLYQILTGVSPPSETEDAAQKVDSVVVMQALIHRPRDHVFETLNVICDILPDLKRSSDSFVEELLESVGVPSDLILAKSRESALQKRLDGLKGCKAELRRFAVILFPTLADAYSSTVNLSVRQKVLNAQLKMLSHLDVDILEEALRHVPYASFLASIISQQDHALLVAAALEAAKYLLERMESTYRYQFYREGVMAEVKKLAIRSIEGPSVVTQDVPSAAASPTEISTRDASGPVVPEPVEGEGPVEVVEGDVIDSEADDEDVEDLDDGRDDGSASSHSSASPPPRLPVPAGSSTQDTITKLAQRFIERFETENARPIREKADGIMNGLQDLVSEISHCYESGQTGQGVKLFRRLASYFEGDAIESITSFELLTSKVVRLLLDVFDDPNGDQNEAARTAFLEVFMGTSLKHKVKTSSSSSPATPFSVLVHKLQDLLSRSEHFEVVTVHHNALDGNKSSATSMLGKQMRIKLLADDESGIPGPYRSVMVQIHAIATFKALDDYLRPRIAAMEQRPRGGRPRDSAMGGSTYSSAMAAMERNELFGSRGAPSTPPPPQSGEPSSSRGSGRKASRPKSSGTAPGAEETPTSSAAGTDEKRPRRSSRKSKPRESRADDSTLPSGESPLQEDATQNTLECADEAPLSEDPDQHDDDDGTLDTIVGELEEEVDDGDTEPSAVNMEVASTGKITARQDDGTRVATPTRSAMSSRPTSSAAQSATDMARSLLSGMTGRSMSYAAAVQAVPTDWHLEFEVNGQPLSNATTIYHAVHTGAHGQSSDFSRRNIWSAIHSINFKKAQGPPPPEPSTLATQTDRGSAAEGGFPASLDKNPITADILRLLRILHEMNSHLEDVLPTDSYDAVRVNVEPLAQFVNTKLTAKLNRQLEEPLIVASNCLPRWSEDLARLYPFLFPFETRHVFLQSTSFGYARSMVRWQSSQPTSDSRRERHRDERPFLGRPQRQKVRISRHKILESAMKVMELYGASPSILEIEFFHEVGTGLGPTLEFYSTVSKEFSKKKLRLWRDIESDREDEFAFGKHGLFPAPMSAAQAESSNGTKILGLFTILGKFVARAMLDSRIIDVSFNPTFFRVTEDSNSVNPSLGAVKAVDEGLANSLQKLKQFAVQKKKIDESRLTLPQKAQKLSRIQVGGASVDDLSLDFTLPGYSSIELVPNGANTPVTIDNIGEYIDKVIDYTLFEGVRRQIEAFRSGFSQVFPYSALKAFTPDELVMLFGRVDEDWSIETLMDSVKADHGFNLDSKSVRNLLQIMSEYPLPMRRAFLQFITGSPKLPIGGFKALSPMFTVVCKPSEGGLTSDDYLPSVMTCVNYLKLPEYSSLDVMRAKLDIAIKEGQGAFHLS